MKLSTDKEGEIEFSKGIESSGGKENERHLTTRGCPGRKKAATGGLPEGPSLESITTHSLTVRSNLKHLIKRQSPFKRGQPPVTR
jgi:hypothetical protein